jgi:hypothetical protein
MIANQDQGQDPEPTGTAVAGEPSVESTRDLEVEIDVEDPAPARSLDPAELREAIAAGLKTTNAEVLEDAAGDFRGVHRDVMEYIRLQLSELLQPWLAWVLECCENDRLRHGYEAGKILVWTLPHPHDPRLLLIFESPRAKFRAPR